MYVIGPQDDALLTAKCVHVTSGKDTGQPDRFHGNTESGFTAGNGEVQSSKQEVEETGHQQGCTKRQLMTLVMTALERTDCRRGGGLATDSTLTGKREDVPRLSVHEGVVP